MICLRISPVSSENSGYILADHIKAGDKNERQRSSEKQSPTNRQRHRSHEGRGSTRTDDSHHRYETEWFLVKCKLNNDTDYSKRYCDYDLDRLRERIEQEEIV